MLRARIIPCLLVHQGGLVKTRQFKNPKYVGDPINAVRIFNEKEADELMVLDIDASARGIEPDFRLIEKLAAECSMPLCYGGGVTSAAQVKRIVDMGVEKVAISSAAVNDPSILNEMAATVGRQSVVAVLDVRKRKGLFSRGYELCTHNATRTVDLSPLELAKQMQQEGAGEIVVNFVDEDGMMQGYDLDYAKSMGDISTVPITFLGGAGSLEHVGHLLQEMGVVGAAAGSLFVFKGKFRAVLINYPLRNEKMAICKNAKVGRIFEG